MINLPNDCKCSELSVYPKNWKSKTAKISFDWHIFYRFYDPDHSKPKQVMVKGMNHFTTLPERQKATEKALSNEMDKLTRSEYNPFKKLQNELKDSNTLNDNNSLVEALKRVSSKLEISERTKLDLKYMLLDVEKAAKVLGLTTFPISQVSRKTIKLLLETASNSSDRFNKNRSYLMILFSELCELEILETNPVRDIRKKKVVKRLREVLNDNERMIVNEHLRTNYPEFHRFLHIFFHSGARISELLRVIKSDVDLHNQRFKMTIQKGREYREVWRTIKDLALNFWQEILLEATHDSDFLFSKGLKPGFEKIQPYQIGKRWYRLVKKKLGIKADFYSLKHLHTTEIIDLINESEAAKHNEHTSTAMVIGIYDVKRNERKHSKVKSLNNKFA